jgi:hypothetical protein
MMKNPTGRWMLAAALMCCVVPKARCQEAFRAWVALYEPVDYSRLENENRIGELCTESSTLDECYARQLGPSVSVYTLRRLPDESSDRVGDLLVVAVPGRGLSAHFHPAGSVRSIPFTPDLYLQDWGYGPYFHQTIAEQRGDWFRLPHDPWEGGAWLLRAHEPDVPSVLEVQGGDIIEMNGTGWFVVDAERDALLLRAEQPGDLWCEEGDPPPITPAEPTRRSRAELVDSHGHLLFRLKYMKGC